MGLLYAYIRFQRTRAKPVSLICGGGGGGRQATMLRPKRQQKHYYE